jgi:tRNA(Arg) A34 adenosine deaminase TadA
MQLAFAKAREGIAAGQTPFGACIAKNGEPIVCAHNNVWRSVDSTAHAEMVAIREACIELGTIDLAGCAIYSTTEPCPMCFAACHWAKISKIVFGARIEDAKRFGFSELAISNMDMKRLGGSHMIIEVDFMRSESLALFESWAARFDKRTY